MLITKIPPKPGLKTRWSSQQAELFLREYFKRPFDLYKIKQKEVIIKEENYKAMDNLIRACTDTCAILMEIVRNFRNN